jgi:negative regulator of sigma E activity
MNDQDQEKLSLFLDGALAPEDAAEVARLVATDPEWKAAHRALKLSGEMMRAPVEQAARSANFDGLWAGIEGRLPAPERAPSLLERLRAFLTPPVLVGLAAAAAAAAYVATRPAPTPAPASPSPGLAATPRIAPAPESALAAAPADASEPVVIEGIESEGSKTVLVSQPVEPGGTTVIWLLDAPDAAGDGAAAPTTDDDPI